MKKIFLILITISLGINLLAEPADNFKKAGIGLGGYLNYEHTFQNFLSDENDKNATSKIDVNPQLSFFVVDNLALSLSPGFTYQNQRYFNSSKDGYAYYPSMTLYGDLSVNYYMTMFGKYVPSIGIFGGLGKWSSLNNTDVNVVNENKSSGYWYNFGLQLVNSYFLTENLAVSLKATSRVSGNLTVKNSDGSVFEYPEDYNQYEEWSLNNQFYLGFTYYIPHGLNKFMLLKK